MCISQCVVLIQNHVAGFVLVRRIEAIKPIYQIQVTQMYFISIGVCVPVCLYVCCTILLCVIVDKCLLHPKFDIGPKWSQHSSC